jgi:uncharacterized protein YndB with AHSA1/START domain
VSKRSIQHGSFVIERTFEAPPKLVFHAFADAAAKARWFAGPPGKWTEVARELDFRVGGRERLSGAFAGGPVSHFNCHFHDIVPNERIVYSYDMHLDDRKISVSLSTVELKPAGKATRMTYTEQAAFLDGYDDAGSREHGSRALFDALHASLKREAAGA